MNRFIFVAAIITLIACQENPVSNDSANFRWEFAEPESQNLSSSLLDSALLQAQSAGFIDGFLVIRNGYLVAEDYYNGYNQNEPHNIKSVSKSMLSAITGLIVDQGYIDSLDVKMLDFFPEYIYPEMDPRKYKITIRHLLTMRMGIRGESDDNYQVYHNLYTSDNWVKNTIEEPLVFDPGERMRYNTFQTHLLSAIITKVTEQSTLDFATDQLFSAMGIDVDSWEQDPQGYYFGGNSMYFIMQEIAVLGYLYLNNGKLNGIQIIPPSWIELTLSPSTDFTHPNAWGELRDYNYAYLWWLGRINQHEMYMGYGYGGQFLIVFPDIEMIVVSTANPEVDPDTATIQEWAIFDIISSYVLPAILD